MAMQRGEDLTGLTDKEVAALIPEASWEFPDFSHDPARVLEEYPEQAERLLGKDKVAELRRQAREPQVDAADAEAAAAEAEAGAGAFTAAAQDMPSAPTAAFPKDKLFSLIDEAVEDKPDPREPVLPKGQIAQGTVGKAVLPSPAGGQPPSTELTDLQKGIGGLRDKDAPALRDAGEGHYRAGRALSEGIQGELDAVTRKATQRDTQFDEDSAKNKFRTLRETLSGAGGTGNFGVTGKAMSQALSSRQDALQDRGDELFKARQESIDKQVARSDEIAAGALVYGQEEANQARTDIRTALDASVQLHNMQRTDEREARRIEADIVLANAGNEVQVAVTNANNAVQSEANRIRDEYGIASLETADTTALLGYAEALAKVKVDAEITIGQVLAELTATIAAVTPPDEIDSDDDVAVKEWRAKTVGAATDRFAATIADLDARIKNVDKRIDAQDTQITST